MMILGVATVLLLFLMAWCLMGHQRNKNFQRFMKIGDHCFYYDGELRKRGTITYIQDNAVHISGEFGESVYRYKTDLYV